MKQNKNEYGFNVEKFNSEQKNHVPSIMMYVLKNMPLLFNYFVTDQ